MKAKSAQQKGKRFEKAVAKIVEEMGLGKAQRQSGSGNGQYKGDISWSLLKTPELKNQPSKFPKILLEWIEQSEKQDLGHYGWVLIIRDPRYAEDKLQAFAVLDMVEYFELEKKAVGSRTDNPDKDLKYKIERIKRLAQDCIKLTDNRQEIWKFKDLKMSCAMLLKTLGG